MDDDPFCVYNGIMIPDSDTIRNSVAPGKALSLVERIADRAVNGKGPFLSAHELAFTYLNDARYKTNEERINAMIRWESSKNFGTGFVSGLGGLVTLPASIPASLGASWVVQARLAGAIAIIHGHSVYDDRVRTMILLSLIGNSAMDELKRLGIELGNKALYSALRQLSGRVIMEINRAVGFRLIARTGQKGLLGLSQVLRLSGGVIGGLFDGFTCRTVGRVADSLFAPGPETTA